MAGLGMALAYLGYSFGLWGYCLVKGYNVTLKDLFGKTWPPGSAADKNNGNGNSNKVPDPGTTPKPGKLPTPQPGPSPSPPR